jgi:hypothetical protein
MIDGVQTDLKEYYVEPAVAQQMADALKAHEAKGDYVAISDGDAFAERLTKDLQDVSHDKHLRVEFSPFKMPPRTEPTPEDEARFHQQMERDNCMFDKVEILPNNIGYISSMASWMRRSAGRRWLRRWVLWRIRMRSSSIYGRTAAANRRWSR